MIVYQKRNRIFFFFFCEDKCLAWIKTTLFFISFWFFFNISHFIFSCLPFHFILTIFLAISTLHSRLLFSLDLFLYLYSSIYSLLSLLSILFCCRALSGCSAKSNSSSYNSPHAISNNSGRAASSVFSAWICGEDRHFSEVSWSASSSFLSFFLCLSLYYICLTAGWVNVVLWKRAMLINLIIGIRMAPINCFLDKKRL